MTTIICAFTNRPCEKTQRCSDPCAVVSVPTVTDGSTRGRSNVYDADMRKLINTIIERDAEIYRLENAISWAVLRLKGGKPGSMRAQIETELKKALEGK